MNTPLSQQIEQQTEPLNPKARSIKCVIIGDANVGKTSLVEKSLTNKFKSKACSTIGVDYRVLHVKGVKPVDVKLWDTAGHERFQSITRTYYRDADCIIVAYSANSIESFKNVTKWVDEVRKNAGENIPILLVGTKKDLLSTLLKETEVYSMAEELTIQGPVFTSSKTMSSLAIINAVTPFFRAVATTKTKENSSPSVHLEYCTGNRKPYRTMSCCF